MEFTYSAFSRVHKPMGSKTPSKTNHIVSYFENEMAWHKPKQILHLFPLFSLIYWRLLKVVVSKW